MKQGEGKYTYHNGDYFEGTFKGDKKEGNGCFHSDGIVL